MINRNTLIEKFDEEQKKEIFTRFMRGVERGMTKRLVRENSQIWANLKMDDHSTFPT